MRERVGRLCGWAVVAAALAAGAGGAAAGEPVVVLDTAGMWRMHHTLRPPDIETGGGLVAMDLRWTMGERVLHEFEWASSGTPPPPKDWAAPAFDDSQWLQGPARMSCLTPMLSRLCMRGKFTVTNPAKAGDLRLRLAYRGGVIVRLNGREVARHDVSRAMVGGEPVARGYPAEAFAPPGGWNGKSPSDHPKETEQEAALRRRTAEVDLPASLLREGVNVLALEVVRAPCHAVVEENKGKRGTRYCAYTVSFNPCQIEQVQLVAPGGGEGLVPASARPAGLQVWTVSMLDADYDLDFGEPGPAAPVRLVGARNGSFSGKVLVGSREAIRGLRAEMSDLSGRGGRTIPAARVRVRYGQPWGREAGVNGQRTIYRASVPEFNCYARVPTMLGALAEEPPEEVPVREAGGRGEPAIAGAAEPVAGAVTPVWVTVDVPADAAPGAYRGELTLRAAGQAAQAVAVELEVADYVLPEPQDYATILELIQSPDTLVVEYGVERWSDAHFALIERSMKLMRECGIGIVYVPLIAQTNHGNEQSMVRWVPAGEGVWEWDFSAMDRYLDLAGRHLGRPRVVCFIAWDIYLGGSGGGYKDTYSHNQRSVELRKGYIGKGPLVTMVDRATGEVRTDHVPPYTDAAARAAWRKLFTELRRRMAARGWEQSMMVGLLSDDWPTQDEQRFYHEVTGGLPWVSHSHIPVTRECQSNEGGIVVTGVSRQGDAVANRAGFRVGYHSAVLSCSFPDNDAPLGSLGGWGRSDMGCYQPRYEGLQPASRWRQVMEINITGAQRGVSRGGADFWPAVRDRRGNRSATVADRYPQSAWRNLDIPWTMFAPGATGPVSTHRYEALREGIQECQARILIEQALADEAARRRLGDALAAQCESLLVERTHAMLKAYGHLQISNHWGHLTGPGPICRQIGVNGHRWYVSSDWQDRSRRLYALAGQVARRLGRR